MERRLAAILAADVGGCSRQMGAAKADQLVARRLFRAWNERYRALDVAQSVSKW